MANRRPPFKIPAVINPPERRCIQISVPDDTEHIQIFAGLTRQLLDWQRWERDPLKRGTQVAQVWRDVWNSIDWTGEDCMGCCPEPTNRRYNSDGQLEVSYDGGITWTPAPDADNRYSGAISPPLDGADGSEKRCIGAASAMEFVKQNLIDELTEGATYADLTAAMVALVAALGVTGVGILVAAFVAAIFIAGVAAVQAAFTSEVWQDFQCILYCASEDDASFTEAGWQEVKTEINATYSGVVAAVLYNWVNSVGLVGLTNAARSGFAAAADCTSCECPNECIDETNIIIGSFVEKTDISITIDAVFTTYLGTPGYWAVYGSEDDQFCCYYCSYEIMSGATASGDLIDCNGDGPDNDPGYKRRAQFAAPSAFQIRFVFDPDGNGCA